jgi:hypothetical protein
VVTRAARVPGLERIHAVARESWNGSGWGVFLEREIALVVSLISLIFAVLFKSWGLEANVARI